MVSSNGMRVKIDKAGRVVVPKAIRDRLGLRPDTEIELVERSDGAFLKAQVDDSRFETVSGLLIHRGRAEASADWDGGVNDSRTERLDAVLRWIA